MSGGRQAEWEMSSTALLIDDRGTVWDSRSAELRSELQCIGAGFDFVDYAIKNLGFVGVTRRGSSAATIRLRPQTVAPMAFARLIHWLSEERFARMLVSTYRLGGWQHALHGSTLAAYRAITAAMRTADRDGNFDQDVLSRPASISSLQGDNPLRAALEYWRSVGGDWGNGERLAELGKILSDRYVLFELRAGGEFVVREFGDGLPDCAVAWLRWAVGQRVQDQPDKQYGWSCALAYEASVQRGEPALQDVDAYVQWWKRERERRRYKRLLLPFAAGNSLPTYLLSASVADPSIDLRSAV